METVGTIEINSSIGLSGHPGCVAGLYTFPLANGSYRIAVERAEKARYCSSFDVVAASGRVVKIAVRPLRENICSEGTGVMIGDFAQLQRLREHFDSYDYDNGGPEWNVVADALCLPSSITEIVVPEIDFRYNFAFVRSEEYYAAFPILDANEAIIGYRIKCDQDFSNEANARLAAELK